MKRENPRYKVQPMRTNNRFFMVTDTHRVIAIELMLTEEQAIALAAKRNAA